MLLNKTFLIILKISSMHLYVENNKGESYCKQAADIEFSENVVFSVPEFRIYLL